MPVISDYKGREWVGESQRAVGWSEEAGGGQRGLGWAERVGWAGVVVWVEGWVGRGGR